MARFAITQRPPILASVFLAAGAVLLGPQPPAAVAYEPMTSPTCIVQGERHGEIIVPRGHWTTPELHPDSGFRMPILGYDPPVIDVDRLVSGLKHLLDTPKT